MAWDGYFEYAGQEFINVARTEKYAETLGWFRPVFRNDAIGPMLGETYVSPMVDNAPWTDPDDGASYEFYGVYPVSVDGIEDSTNISGITESTGDGGTAGRIRRSTRAVVFGVLLLAASEAGAEYGVRWLRALLLGSACGNLATETCNGDDLCFLSSEPQLDSSGADDPTECFEPYQRSLRKVVINSGPTVTSKRDTSDGAAFWTVSFTAIAGNPYQFGPEIPVVAGFMDPDIADPYSGDLSGTIDLDGFIYTGGACAIPVYTPVYDPLCPAIVSPPEPPTVPLGCYTEPVNWRRRQFTIPNTLLPLWGEVVPQVRVTAGDVDVRNLRLRFYADVNGDGSITDDPCAYCGDIVISYVPSDTTLVFDGSDKVIYVEYPGGIQRRADNLVFATDGTPFEWPSLTCGFGYVVTVDLPQTQTPPTVDLSLFSRVA